VHELNLKVEAVSSLESEIETLQCTLLCEREKNKALNTENANTRGQLQMARERNKKLQDELTRVTDELQERVSNQH